MKRPLLTVIGSVIGISGLVWTLQGLGYIGGSSMSGVAVWAIIGPIVAGLGVALVIVAQRRHPHP